MRALRRTMTIAALVAGLLLATVGVAAAAEPETQAPLDLDTLRERVIDQIDRRIARFEDRLADLEGREGPRVEQLTALLVQGSIDLEQLKVDTASAESVAEIHGLVRRAHAEFAAHARVRTLYAHVQTDLAKFGHRPGCLEQAIDRAEGAGLDTSCAIEQAAAAEADLGTAADLLSGVDPGAIGDGVLAQLRAAHRTAHAAQGHIRWGFRALAAAAV